MNIRSANQLEGFALFTEAAERYCLGLSNGAMRSYALKYLTFLQARAQGEEQEEPIVRSAPIPQEEQGRGHRERGEHAEQKRM